MCVHADMCNILIQVLNVLDVALGGSPQHLPLKEEEVCHFFDFSSLSTVPALMKVLSTFPKGLYCVNAHVYVRTYVRMYGFSLFLYYIHCLRSIKVSCNSMYALYHLSFFSLCLNYIFIF